MRRGSVLGVIGWLGISVASLGIVLRWVRSDLSPAIALAAASPLTLALTLAGVLLFLAAHRWFGVVSALVVLALQVVTIAPLYLPDSSPSGTALVVLQANLRLGQADAGALVGAIREHNAGVVTVNELTAAGRDKLVAAQIDSLMPYSYTTTEEDAGGTGIWSKYPLTPVRQDDQAFAFHQMWAVADIPGAGQVMLVAAHIHPPDKELRSSAWLGELDRFGSQLQALRPGLKVVVGGDFNATYDHFAFRQMLTGGYADAVDQAGAGWLPTWREGHVYTRLIGIDHVITRGVMATAVSTEQLPGSDHRALVATVVIPVS